VNRSWKVFAGALSASAIVLGPAFPAWAGTFEHQVDGSFLRDGNPPAADASDAHWYREDTRVGGAVQVYQSGDPGALPAPGGDLGDGALALTTDHRTSAKAQLMTLHHVYGTPLADVDGLDYWTLQSSDSQPGVTNPVVLPSLQLQIDTNGVDTAGGFTTLVFEPYQETPAGPSQPITPDTWQFWDATSKQWWSSRAIHCEGGSPDDPFDLAAGAGGPPFTTPATVAGGCPGAVVLGYGVNVGSNNPDAVTATDGLHFSTVNDDFTWNFGPK
jgi:hypothetical protein